MERNSFLWMIQAEAAKCIMVLGYFLQRQWPKSMAEGYSLQIQKILAEQGWRSVLVRNEFRLICTQWLLDWNVGVDCLWGISEL